MYFPGAFRRENWQVMGLLLVLVIFTALCVHLLLYAFYACYIFYFLRFLMSLLNVILWLTFSGFHFAN